MKQMHGFTQISAMLVLGGLMGCAGSLATGPVGSSHVAVLSVTSWQDYKAALSPKYNLTEAAALDSAIPDTRLYEVAVLDALRARVGIRVAPSAVLTEGFGAPTVAAGAPEGAPATQPGVTAAGEPVELPALDGDTPRLPSDLQLPSHDKLKGDAVLKYLAGTALFQEVKLLERYVLDAAQRNGYEPFIVRLQIANQPFGDDKAYDLFSNIAFFMDRVGTEVFIPKQEELRARLAAIETQKAELSSRLTGVFVQSADRDRVRIQLNEATLSATRIQEELQAVTAQATKPPQSHKTPVIVPLLVTDQIEAALLSGRADELRQMALSVAAAYAGIGGDLQLEKVDQLLEKAAGRSHRSTFTVGRLANNILRVRIGAKSRPQLDAKSKSTVVYETIARTHNVSLLVLVPNDVVAVRPVYLATRSEFHDPQTGARLMSIGDQGSPMTMAARAAALIANGGYQLHPNAKVEQPAALSLLTRAQANEYEEFLNEAEKLMPGSEARRLFLDMVIAKIGVDFDSTDFEVNISPKRPPSFGTGMVYGLDGGETMQVVADGVSGIDPLKVSATWNGIQLRGASGTFSYASTGAELRGRSQLVVTFPSLLKLGLVAKGGSVAATGSISFQSDSIESAPPRPVATVLFAGVPAETPSLLVNRSTAKLNSTSQTAPTQALTLGFIVNESATPPPAAFADDPSILAAMKGQKYYFIAFDGVEAAISAAPAQTAVKAVANFPGVFMVVGSGSAKFDITQAVDKSKMNIRVLPPLNGKPVGPLEFTIGSTP